MVRGRELDTGVVLHRRRVGLRLERLMKAQRLTVRIGAGKERLVIGRVARKLPVVQGNCSDDV